MCTFLSNWVGGEEEDGGLGVGEATQNLMRARARARVRVDKTRRVLELSLAQCHYIR